MIEEVKKLRVKIDGLAQLTKNLKPIKIEKSTFERNIGLIKNKNDFEYVDKGLIIVLEKSNSKEIDKAVDSLYLAKAWLGKVLGELNVDSPYKSGYKTKEDIEPTADTSKVIENLNKHPEINNLFEGLNWKESSHIEKVDHLRTQVEKLVLEIKEILTKDLSREFAIARTNTYNYLCEARFWLRFELQRIKEES